MILNRLFPVLTAAFLIALLTACSDKTTGNETDNAVSHAQKHLDASYVCPMHPKIIKAEAGTCPLCGMELVKISRPEKGNSASSTPYPVVQLTSDIMQKLAIRTTRVKRASLQTRIKTVGYVGYNRDRLKTITTKTNGWIENLAIRFTGNYVKKGQLLFELYSPEFLTVQKEFLAAQKKDNSGIHRQYSTRQESLPSRDRLRYMGIPQSMLNQIARQGKPLHRIPHYAPMQGTIIRYEIHKNQYVYDGEPLLTLADLSTVWVEANVYEHQLAWLRLGLAAEIGVKALPGKKYKGEVNYIHPELDEKTRSLKVRIRVPNTDGRLKPNMFAYVTLFSDPTKKKLQIPREALIVTGERESVILELEKGKYKPVDVVTGVQSNGLVEILSGLKNGDNVVTSGQFLIDSEANLQASFKRLDSK